MHLVAYFDIICGQIFLVDDDILARAWKCIECVDVIVQFVRTRKPAKLILGLKSRKGNLNLYKMDSNIWKVDIKYLLRT